MKIKYSLSALRLFTLICMMTGWVVNTNAQCSSVTPAFTIDLSSNASASYTSPTVTRDGTCCSSSDPCVKFVITLHPNAMGINFSPIGADPGGSLNYQIGCGTPTPGGTPICLNSAGPHTLTVCKPGGNPNSYYITSIPKPNAPDSIMVRNGCTQTLSVSGFSVPTIQWTAVPNNTLYNSYLSCTSGCSLVTVTPTGVLPAYVDYEVSGYGVAPCLSSFYRDTVRVYFYNDLQANITPTTICFGSINAVVTVTATGGKPALTYSWSTGGTAPTVTVGAGNYTVLVGDQTGCPPVTATVAVSNFTLPITANAGADITVCKSSPNATINRTITAASGGSWTSAGGGTFTPSPTVNPVTYIPTPGEVSTGSTQLIVTTTGNQGCTADSDTIVIFYQNPPVVAVSNQTVCANNAAAALSATITGFPASPIWSSPGSGSFSSLTATSTIYTPGGADISAGTVSVIVTTTNNGACPQARDTAVVIITPAPVVLAGNNFSICSNSNASVNGTVTIAGSPITGSWSTTGNGSFLNSNALSTNYTPGSLDISTGSVSLILTSTGNGNCLAVRDTMVLFIRGLPTVSVVPPSTVCSITAPLALSGTITGATNTGSWSTSGTGSFNNNTILNPAYTLSNADRLLTSLVFTLTSTNNGPCPAVMNSTTINIVPTATVNAGLNQTICSSDGTIALSGTVTTPPGTAAWTGGSGSFSNAGNLVTAYNLAPQDIAAGSVIFTLTSTNNNVCPAETDTVRINIVPIATVSAGPNLVVCSSSGVISLSGTVTGAQGGNWTASGSGAFNPGNNVLATSYNITSGDINNGTVTFTLNASANAPCALVNDTVRVRIITLPIVNAGLNRSICSSENPFGWSGASVTGVGTGSWSTSGSGSFSNISSLTTSYSPGSTDITSGTVIFTLTSTNNGICPAVSDTVQMRIIRSATVSTSPNTPVCSNAGNISLSGTVTSTSNTGIWSASGSGGFSPANTNLTTSYQLTPTDIQNGTVTFTLSSTNDGPCASQLDTVSIRVFQIATVNAGAVQWICTSQGTVALNGGVISSAGTGSWSSSGSGTFLSGNNSLAGSYSLSPNDHLLGSVIFTLTSTGNGVCPAVSDTVKITVTRQPSVVAGPSQAVCSSSLSVPLNGSVAGSNGTGVWLSSGNGGFNPSNTALVVNYQISPSDISAGSVLLTLFSTNSFPCQETKDTLRINIKTPAIAEAGTYSTVCSSQGSIALNGSVSGGGQTASWATSGTGAFVPDNNNLNATYAMSQSDYLNGGVTLTLTTTNNGACPPSSEAVTIAIKQQATVTAAPDKTICSTLPVFPISANISGVTTTGVWVSDGTGTLDPNSVAGNYTISAADITKGTVNFIVTSTNNDVCPPDKDTLVVKIIRNPVITWKSDTTICEKESPIDLVPSVSFGSGSYQWATSGTGNFSPNAFNIPTAYNVSEGDVKAGSVMLTLSAINNGPCVNVNSTMVLRINPSPDVDFTASSYTVNLPKDPPINFTNTSKGALSYLWNFGDNTSANSTNATKLYADVGFYTVTLIGNNQYACTDTASKVITVIKEVLFPTAFTPNGDNLNPVFKPITGGVTEYNLMIFNRWGELIFQSTELNYGWDGTFNGKVCQQDAYVWKADMTFFDGRKYSRTGSVTLIR